MITLEGIFCTRDAKKHFKQVRGSVKTVFGHSPKFFGILEPDPAALDKPRKQFDARLLLDQLVTHANGRVCLWLVDADIFAKDLKFVFGLGAHHVGAVLSTHRLVSKPGILEKEAVHETGHVLGLHHCESGKNGCVMNFSNTLEAVGKKSHALCKDCKKKLHVKLFY